MRVRAQQTAGFLFLVASTQAAAYQSTVTQIDDVVMYAIENDSSELLRYTFVTDEFVTIGQVRDQNGNVLPEDMETAALIPWGPHMGIYAVCNYFEASGKPSRLLRVSGFDASAWVYPTHIGFGKVEGMVAKELTPGNWVLVASSARGPELANGNPKSSTNQGPHIFLIDPATGQALPGGEPSQHSYEGLALNPQNVLYGVDPDSKVYRLNVVFSPFDYVGEVSNVAFSPNYDQPETLEWAYGDNQPAVIVGNSVPASWTANGILFSFSDDADAFLVINPLTGEVKELNCSFTAFDAEGLIFTTKRRDPWGVITVDACD